MAAAAVATAAALLLLLQGCFASPAESPCDKASQKCPHLVGCVSANMETFRCSWDLGAFQNLSEPGDLRLFYMKIIPTPNPSKEWSECPHYSTQRPNECFFDANHTSIWTPYATELRSRDQAVIYDELRFNVEDIVQPDPPIALNWTLLNVSLTASFYDVRLSWRPPTSADVEMGWIRLEYQVQHRRLGSQHWEAVELVRSTQRTLYGLQTNVDHEVRVRCKMVGQTTFGEFSESVIIHIQSKGSRFPLVAWLVFGALCVVAVLMLVIISQQEKLMFILLPPVPGPKIKGINSEMLKKGKLRELTSILDGPPDLRPELYSDPWVEFIDLDMEEAGERLTELDTDCLVDGCVPSHCSPVSGGFRDDDSGRASCCDPDLPSEPEGSPFQPLAPHHALTEDSIAAAAATATLPAAQDASYPQEALYTQVSEVRASGKVLLVPEEQPEEQEEALEKEKKERKKEFQLRVVEAEQRGYTSELQALSALPPPSPPPPPPPVYTVVEGVLGHNGLLLTPNSTPAPPPPPPLQLPKALPTPDGYLTPELLGSVTP